MTLPIELTLDLYCQFILKKMKFIGIRTEVQIITKYYRNSDKDENLFPTTFSLSKQEILISKFVDNKNI